MKGLSKLCNVHFFNPYNLKRYSYNKTNILRIFTSASDAPIAFIKGDIEFAIEKDHADLTRTLASQMDYDNWLISKTGVLRPWGPGIMHESVIYTLVHFGVTTIHTIGWDIADINGNNIHFYDQKQSISERLEMTIFNILNKTRLGWVMNFYWFLAGKKYNRAGMLPEEAKITSKSLVSMKSWLATRGICLHVHSSSGYF
jgi:hypothetical protein